MLNYQKDVGVENHFSVPGYHVCIRHEPSVREILSTIEYEVELCCMSAKLALKAIRERRH